MLTVFRSNRAEFLASVLAQQLLLDPPGPWETVQVVVNTWPTSRWLGEQLAVELGGIAANLRFPFPGSHLRQIVNHLLGDDPGGADPWRATNLVWPLLELLPELVASDSAALLARWLEGRSDRQALDGPLWQLGRAIADSFDDLSLYRPDLESAWLQGLDHGDRGGALPPLQGWQPLLFRRLHDRLGVKPFGLRVIEAIERLGQGTAHTDGLVGPLRLFGLSSSAPLQVQLLQALAGTLPVDLYLLTPCRDLWQRCRNRRRELSDAIALAEPFALDWVEQAPGLEARFGRLGGEFQQLLEGTGEAQLGRSSERDLFFLPATAASEQARRPDLLEQLQEQMVDTEPHQPLKLEPGDQSLEFHPCPGRLRQVQIVRDRLLQLMATDASLEPRHILVMTPDVDRLAPLLAAVFGDAEATGVLLPWRLTDRSQQSEAGIAAALLQLLKLGGERLTASAFQALLESAPLQEHFQLDAAEAAELNGVLQACGFRWGLAAGQRSGDASHSLAWAIDRLLLGLVLPDRPGVAAGGCAPHQLGGAIERIGRWIHLLTSLQQVLTELDTARSSGAWAERLPLLLSRLFGDGGERGWELQLIREAIAEWTLCAGSCTLQLTAPVVAAVLEERLSADSGRFGHRSGALTVSALEPMRAIPYRVIALIGLDAGSFPRLRQRPGFHLMEKQRRLGDPSTADQDRYVLMEALLSARDNLLLFWNCRDEHSGEQLPPAAPIRQWLELLRSELGEQAAADLVIAHRANPLDRQNFLPSHGRAPASCDRRLLRALERLEQPEGRRAGSGPRLTPAAPLACRGGQSEAPPNRSLPAAETYQALRDWLVAPQGEWLKQLGLRPREWVEPIEDLEDLELSERQRATLLRQALTEAGSPMPADPPDWSELTAGRGLLPPHAGAELERQVLDQRWTSLGELLASFGEARLETHHWPGLSSDREDAMEATVCWHGQRLVLLQTKQARAGHRLELTLQWLLAIAAGAPGAEAVLIARDQNSFKEQERLRAPSPADASAHLQQWLEWQRQHRPCCWPVPPSSGWAYAAAEWKKPGSGAAKARTEWEGSDFGGHAEREEEVMALCFGSSTPFEELLEGRFGPFTDLTTALHTPLLELGSRP